MSYPDFFIRGISGSNGLDEEGAPAAYLFYFGEKNLPIRKDGYWEESINWQDDDGALTLLLEQKKDTNEYQFKVGAVFVSRHEIDRIRKLPYVGHQLDYERKELPENKYHGNLLLQNTVSKARMKRIAAAIALSADKIFKRDEA